MWTVSVQVKCLFFPAPLPPPYFFFSSLRPSNSAAASLESQSLSVSPPKYLNTAHTPPALRCERNCSQLILQTHSGELINSSLRAVFNYSVKWSVNGQSEIYYIILYISELSASKPTILGLLWPRSYRITDIWNCIQRHKQLGGISNT